MNKRKEIIDLIKRNRISTTEVADALGKTGVLSGLSPVTPDHFSVGAVRCIFTAHMSNHALHEQARDIQEGEIAVVFAHDCEGRALIGDLIAKYILLYRNAAGLVVDGLVRDASRLRRERYGIWSRGATPLGCYNVPAKSFPDKRKKEIIAQCEGGVAVCDDGGVTIIPPNRLDADMLERLERIELQEDVWYYCLNTLKWDTKRIVCDKEYLKDRKALPAPMAEQLDRLERPLDAKK